MLSRAADTEKSSSSGLTRGSHFFTAMKWDARVKPAHDKNDEAQSC